MTESKKSLNRRNFLANLTKVMGGVGGIFAVIPFLSTMSPSEKAKSAGAPIEIDVSGLKPGAFKVVEWRGKPVWVVRRTAEMINNTQEDNDILTDPKSLEEHQPKYTQNKFRSLNPEYLVLLGICTHLGCVPLGQKISHTKGEYNGWYCPCHGSHYDTSGRIRKGPAPDNLAVPPYKFLDDTTILIG